jgi:hypothetical protein
MNSVFDRRKEKDARDEEKRRLRAIALRRLTSVVSEKVEPARKRLVRKGSTSLSDSSNRHETDESEEEPVHINRRKKQRVVVSDSDSADGYNRDAEVVDLKSGVEDEKYSHSDSSSDEDSSNDEENTDDTNEDEEEDSDDEDEDDQKYARFQRTYAARTIEDLEGDDMLVEVHAGDYDVDQGWSSAIRQARSKQINKVPSQSGRKNYGTIKTQTKKLSEATDCKSLQRAIKQHGTENFSRFKATPVVFMEWLLMLERVVHNVEVHIPAVLLIDEKLQSPRYATHIRTCKAAGTKRFLITVLHMMGPKNNGGKYNHANALIVDFHAQAGPTLTRYEPHGGQEDKDHTIYNVPAMDNMFRMFADSVSLRYVSPTVSGPAEGLQSVAERTKFTWRLPSGLVLPKPPKGFCGAYSLRHITIRVCNPEKSDLDVASEFPADGKDAMREIQIYAAAGYDLGRYHERHHKRIEAAPSPTPAPAPYPIPAPIISIISDSEAIAATENGNIAILTRYLTENENPKGLIFYALRARKEEVAIFLYNAGMRTHRHILIECINYNALALARTALDGEVFTSEIINSAIIEAVLWVNADMLELLMIQPGASVEVLSTSMQTVIEYGNIQKWEVTFLRAVDALGMSFIDGNALLLSAATVPHTVNLPAASVLWMLERATYDERKSALRIALLKSGNGLAFARILSDSGVPFTLDAAIIFAVIKREQLDLTKWVFDNGLGHFDPLSTAYVNLAAYAAKHHKYSSLKFLLDKFPIYITAENQGRTLMMTSIMSKNMRAIALLAVNGADVNTQVEDVFALTAAVMAKSMGTLEALLNNGANATQLSGRNQETLIGLLSHNKPLKAFAYARLVAAGCPFDNPDRYGYTPIMRAATGNNAMLATLLLESGADKHRLLKGKSAVAMGAKHPQIAQLLA